MCGEHVGDVSYRPTAVGGQPRRERARQEKRRLDVQRERRVELVVLYIVRGAKREHAGVVDEDIDVLDLRCKPLNVLVSLLNGAEEPGSRSFASDRVDDLQPAPLFPYSKTHVLDRR